MLIFYINLNIVFLEPMDFYNEKGRREKNGIDGFFQEIGCTTKNEKNLKKIIESYYQDVIDIKNVKIDYERIGIIAKDTINDEIYSDPEICDALIGNPHKEGIWYLSGKAFYRDDEKKI